EVIEETEEPTFFVAVEEMPQPIGGLQGIQAKISYPEIAKRAGIEGKVFVRAYVDETGAVVNAEVVKGIGGGCDEAALDAILKTKFTPGKQRGKAIKVQVTVPVLFRL
ncbi:MAG TPA: energy transducer TonB, partial [Ignavibacteriaceae bacterium]